VRTLRNVGWCGHGLDRLQLICIPLGRYTEIDLKFTILDGLSPEQVMKQLPKRYMERAQLTPLRGDR
jgi:hypothetical protein